MKEVNIKNISITFIVGCGRSGTTLLQSLTNSHPNIVSTDECLFVIALYPLFGKIKNWTKVDILRFADALQEVQVFKRWLLNKEELTQKLLSVMEIADYPLLCKMVYYEMRNDKEKVMVLIDKNPLHSLFLRRLLTIFPEAKFIHIIRDPRDNINSNIRRFNKKNTFFLAEKWVGFNAAIEKVKRKSPDIFFTIIYEEMVTNAENVFMPLCQFLGVAYDTSIMNNQFPERIQSYEGLKFYDQVKRTHESLLEPINTTNIGKWRSEMSAYDMAITELITAKFAHKYYGYDVKADKMSACKVSVIKLFKSHIQYYMWEVYTKLRFSNYKLNMYYLKRKNASSKLMI